MAIKQIILAEDDENLGLLLMTYLSSKGFVVLLAKTGNQALALYRENKSNLGALLLDVMMPEKDGYSVAQEVRLTDQSIPIIFITAKGLNEDKLRGFDIGADDYLTKPFSMDELLARLNAVMRRSSTEANSSNKITLGKFEYEPNESKLIYEGSIRKLTTKENALLRLLVENRNQVMDRQETLRAIWGDDNYFNGRSMDVYIAKLRKLLSQDKTIEILNIHGVGFKLIIQ
ncbi:MAG: response regulator transcription factor [Flavobacteriales bacterium]|jgi:two-component system OmpR family response regulator